MLILFSKLSFFSINWAIVICSNVLHSKRYFGATFIYTSDFGFIWTKLGASKNKYIARCTKDVILMRSLQIFIYGFYDSKACKFNRNKQCVIKLDFLHDLLRKSLLSPENSFDSYYFTVGVHSTFLWSLLKCYCPPIFGFIMPRHLFCRFMTFLCISLPLLLSDSLIKTDRRTILSP